MEDRAVVLNRAGATGRNLHRASRAERVRAGRLRGARVLLGESADLRALVGVKGSVADVGDADLEALVDAYLGGLPGPGRKAFLLSAIVRGLGRKAAEVPGGAAAPSP
jgi:hypothetical protein